MISGEGCIKVTVDSNEVVIIVDDKEAEAEGEPAPAVTRVKMAVGEMQALVPHYDCFGLFASGEELSSEDVERGTGSDELVKDKIEIDDDETARVRIFDEVGQGEHFVLCLYKEHLVQTIGFDWAVNFFLQCGQLSGVVEAGEDGWFETTC